jgi:hypothetical protein
MTQQHLLAQADIDQHLEIFNQYLAQPNSTRYYLTQNRDIVQPKIISLTDLHFKEYNHQPN